MSDSTKGGNEFGSFLSLYNADAAFSAPGWTSLPTEISNTISFGMETRNSTGYLGAFTLYTGSATPAKVDFNYTAGKKYRVMLAIIRGTKMLAAVSDGAAGVASLSSAKDMTSVMANPKFSVIAGSGSSAKVGTVSNLRISTWK